jgi:hypothetical protein
MAGSDDDIERLLREVDSALGSGSGGSPGRGSASSGGAVQPAASKPAARSAGAAGGREPLAAGLPRATAIGAAWGVGVGGLFFVLPFVHSVSGGLGAFVAAFSVSFLGRLRR